MENRADISGVRRPEQIRSLLKAHRAELHERFHVKEIGLFGSWARGEHGSDSDIDILVVFDRGHKDFSNYMRLKRYLEHLTGREIDLVLKGAVKPRLKKHILQDVEYVS